MFRTLLVLLFTQEAIAATIVASSSFSIVPPGSPSGTLGITGGGSGVVVPGNNISGPPPNSSVALSGSGTSGSASVAGPNSFSDPFVVNINNQLTSTGQGQNNSLNASGAGLNYEYRMNSSISSYAFRAPILSFAVDPGGLDAVFEYQAYIQAQDRGITNGAFVVTSLLVGIQVSGTSGFASMNWDSVGNIALQVQPGISGLFRIQTQNLSSNAETLLLEYAFLTDPITNQLSVTKSTNSFGLNLPAVGSNPSFSGQLFEIAANVSTIDPDVNTWVAVGVLQNARLINNVPEPDASALTCLGLSLIVILRKCNQYRNA